jgi:L-ascorbate metabolism protein UlaG (beta-lactamase superfamily)
MPLQRNKQLCCGYVIERDSKVIYFAGDTGYGEHFKEISSHFLLNAAMLPIGAYKPHEWFREIHLNPQTAMKAFLDLLLEEAKRLGMVDSVRILENGGAVEI